MVVKRFEQSQTEKALYKCSHYYYYYVITRLKEHKDTKGKSVYKHLLACGAREEVSDERDLDILCSTLRGEVHLLTLEALWIREIKPSINVKDEYRSRELTIKF